MPGLFQAVNSAYKVPCLSVLCMIYMIPICNDKFVHIVSFLPRTLTKGVSDFFLGPNCEPDSEADYRLHEAAAISRQKWRNRSILLHSNRLIGGHVRDDAEDVEGTDSVFDSSSLGARSGMVTPATAPATAPAGGPGGGIQVYDPLHRPGTAR